MIEEVLNRETTWSKGLLGLRHQRCYAVKVDKFHERLNALMQTEWTQRDARCGPTNLQRTDRRFDCPSNGVCRYAIHLCVERGFDRQRSTVYPLSRSTIQVRASVCPYRPMLSTIVICQKSLSMSRERKDFYNSQPWR